MTVGMPKLLYLQLKKKLNKFKFTLTEDILFTLVYPLLSIQSEQSHELYMSLFCGVWHIAK